MESRILQEYDKLKSAMMVVTPFISSLLSRVRIVLSDRVPTACVSKGGVMIISPKFWDSLSWSGKAWVLAHETMHIAFRDHVRLGKRDAMAWNIVTDAVNNSMIAEFLKMPKEIELFAVTLEKLYYAIYPVLENSQITREDFQKMSKEEIYRLLPRADCSKILKCPKCGSRDVVCVEVRVRSRIARMRCKSCGFEWDVEITFDGGVGDGVPVPVERVEEDVGRDVDPSDGGVLQEGDPEIYKDGRESDGEDVEEKWKERLAKAYDVQKLAGNVPAGLKRFVDELLKPKIDWRSLLRQSFKTGFGRTVVSTYRRPSRKHDDYPGLRRFTYPTVWCLVDQSGSISYEEARQFLSEVYAIAGDATVMTVVWDARVYDVIEAKSSSEVVEKVLYRLRGGGGTVIAPALETTLERMRNGDVVVVLTDGEIYDLDSDETKRLFSAVSAKSSIAILCSTNRQVELEGWRFIKLEVNNH